MRFSQWRVDTPRDQGRNLDITAGGWACFPRPKERGGSPARRTKLQYYNIGGGFHPPPPRSYAPARDQDWGFDWGLKRWLC
jgi:hypothetical protein